MDYRLWILEYNFILPSSSLLCHVTGSDHIWLGRIIIIITSLNAIYTTRWIFIYMRMTEHPLFLPHQGCERDGMCHLIVIIFVTCKYRRAPLLGLLMLRIANMQFSCHAHHHHPPPPEQQQQQQQLQKQQPYLIL